MTQTKLVALIDGSGYAQSVCDYSIWAAQALSVPIELMHVIGRRQENALDISGALSLGARTRMLEDMARIEGDLARHSQDRGRALIEDAADHIEATLKERPTVRLRTGDLVLEANQALSDTDLLIIASAGGGRVRQAHLVQMERMVRSSNCLFLWRESFKPLGQALIAYDGRSSSKRRRRHRRKRAAQGAAYLVTVNERKVRQCGFLTRQRFLSRQVVKPNAFGKAVEVIRNRVASENSRSWSWAHTAQRAIRADRLNDNRASCVLPYPGFAVPLMLRLAEGRRLFPRPLGYDRSAAAKAGRTPVSVELL